MSNNANMELKNVNPNGDNVVASNLNNPKFFFILNCENWVQKNIISFHVDKDIFYKKKIIIIILEVFWCTCSCPL
jgi:hypothetical protein